MNKYKHLVVAGDSWTYGSEIKDPSLSADVRDWDEENDSYRLPRIWPTKLGTKIDAEKVVNLSYPASSNDRIIRTLYSWLAQEYFVTEKDTSDLFVVVGFTSPERKDFFFDDQSENFRDWITLWPMLNWTHPMKNLQSFNELYVNYFWNEEEYVHRYLEQIFNLQTVFKQYKINYLMFQAFYQKEDLHILNWNDNPYARHFNGRADKLLWKLIDPVRFMHKNDSIHSFHNYILDRDTSKEKTISISGMHPSEIAHTWWAEHIYQYCEEHKIW